MQEPFDQSYRVSPISEWMAADFVACVELLTQGHVVDLELAIPTLWRSRVVVVRDGPSVIGMGAIKPVRPDYAERVAKNAGVPFPSNWRELGYVVVDAAHRGRGVCRAVVTRLTGTRPRFACTADPRMIRVLYSVGFVQHGCSWNGAYQQGLSLWLKP